MLSLEGRGRFTLLRAERDRLVQRRGPDCERTSGRLVGGIESSIGRGLQSNDKGAQKNSKVEPNALVFDVP